MVMSKTSTRCAREYSKVWKGGNLIPIPRWLQEIAEVNIRLEFQTRGYFRVIAFDRTGPPEAESAACGLYINSRANSIGRDISIVSSNSAVALAIPAAKIREQFHLRSGDLVNVEELRNGMERVKELYAARGYVDATTAPNFSFDEGNRSIAVTMMSQPGKTIPLWKR